MRLAILGASGHGKVVADAAERSGWNDVVFYDDAWPDLRTNGLWVVAGDSRGLLEQHPDFDGVVVAIGNNRIRFNKQEALLVAGAKMATIVHPSAAVSPHAAVGQGSVVFANAVVNAFAEIGEGAIVNTGAVVEHDCLIGEFVHISPNAVLAGGVKISRLVWIGACASIRQLITVGAKAVVGMGAVVVRDVPEDVTVAGNPAKPLPINQP